MDQPTPEALSEPHAPASRGPVSRGKGRPSLTETARIDRAIRDAALKVLLEHGEAASLNAVAQAAGLSRKSLYARYPNRSALFLEVVRDLLRDAGPVRFEASGAIEQRFYNYVRAALELMMAPHTLTFQRLLMLDPLYAATLRPDMRRAIGIIFAQPVEELLAEAAAKGEVVVANLEGTVRIIVSVVFARGLAARERACGGEDAEPAGVDYAREVTDLILRGLLPRSA